MSRVWACGAFGLLGLLQACGSASSDAKSQVTSAAGAGVGGASSAAGASSAGGSGGASAVRAVGGAGAAGASAGAPPLGGQAGKNNAGGGGAGAGLAPECVPLENTGPEVQTRYVQGTAPAPMGGTFVSGKYELTDAAYYGTGNCSQVLKETLEINAVSATTGTLRDILTFVGTSTHPTAATYTTDGSSTFKLNYLCFEGMAAEPYTATPTQYLRIVDVTDPCGGTLVDTYTKR